MFQKGLRPYLKWSHKSFNQGSSFKYSPNIDTESATASIKEVNQIVTYVVKSGTPQVF